VTRPPEYVYPPSSAGIVPDTSSTDETWVEDVRRQVQQQLANPSGGQTLVAELAVGHGNLIDDEAAKTEIGTLADRLHSSVWGE
jgi:hypothetical protein